MNNHILINIRKQIKIDLIKILVFSSLFIALPNAVNAFTLLGEVKDIDVSKIVEGACKPFVWNGLPIIVCKRNQTQINRLVNTNNSFLGDPEGNEFLKSMIHAAYIYDSSFANLLFTAQRQFAGTPLRSLRNDIFIAINMSPYLGCALNHVLEGSQHKLGDSWKGGFFNPCRGEKYDYAGRIINGHQLGNNWNMWIPPHRYIGKDILRIGKFQEGLTVSKYDFSPNYYDNYLSNTHRLILSTHWGNMELLKELLQAGVDPNKTTVGVTPLLIASTKNNTEMIRLLIKNGANPDQANKIGSTPLKMALFIGNEEIVRLLIESGAKVNPSCKVGVCEESYLIQVVQRTPNLANASSLIKILLFSGADPKVKYEGKNAVEWAEELDAKNLIKILHMEM